MKILGKLVIISIFVFAHAIQVNVNKSHIEELLNYKINLPKDIYNPFILQNINKPKQIKKVKKIKKIKRIEKKVFKPIIEKKLKLVAILNDKVLLKIEGMGVQKWLKVGEKIGDYTLKKIINSDTILVTIKNKTKIINMKSNINIKAEK